MGEVTWINSHVVEIVDDDYVTRRFDYATHTVDTVDEWGHIIMTHKFVAHPMHGDLVSFNVVGNVLYTDFPYRGKMGNCKVA